MLLLQKWWWTEWACVFECVCALSEHTEHSSPPPPPLPLNWVGQFAGPSSTVLQIDLTAEVHVDVLILATTVHSLHSAHSFLENFVFKKLFYLIYRNFLKNGNKLLLLFKSMSMFIFFQKSPMLTMAICRVWYYVNELDLSMKGTGGGGRNICGRTIDYMVWAYCLAVCCRWRRLCLCMWMCVFVLSMLSGAHHQF